MTYQAHAQAFLDLLDADNAAPALVVFDGFVPSTTRPPYVVVYFAFDSPEPELDMETASLVMNSERVNCTAYCHNVGANNVAVRAVAARTRAALLDIAPAVSGRACFPIRMVENQPAQRDETTGILVMDQVDVYRLSSVPS